MAENASDIVFEADLEGRIQWISPSSQILEWRPEDLHGRSIFDLIFEADHELVAEHRRQVLAGENPGSIEARYRFFSYGDACLLHPAGEAL